jgi:type III secretion protein J
MHKIMKNKFKVPLFFILSVFSLIISGCSENQSIVNNIDEREANEIVVFLASRGIRALKIQAASNSTAGAESSSIQWNIMVEPDQSIEAMAILNHNGLPRRKGTTLLELFAKQGLMTSDREETIRYQAGLEEELKNTIRKIDGVIDVDVQISFPTSEGIGVETQKQKAKAAVYVKHQGILDDPNNHLETKIKRLISGSVESLDFEAVAVISDKSRFTSTAYLADTISPKEHEKDYVSIWSMIMTKKSSQKFRLIFFTLVLLLMIIGALVAYLIYKYYPMLQKDIPTAETEEGSEIKKNLFSKWLKKKPK